MEEAEIEQTLVARLRARDESAFAEIVDANTPAMLRTARMYVASREAAEEVVQETWIALIRGIDGFEGRSTLRTWLFRVLVNIAKTRGVRDHNLREDLAAAPYPDGATVDPDRFRGPDDQWPGGWRAHPAVWPPSPEGSTLAAEMMALTRRDLDKLPNRQRLVVTLRDVLGFDSEEVCQVLSLTMANQRVLLHRGRARVRAALETYLAVTP
ncbi:MAG TPA: sigma-70 family RNA polymerase sigma factor [Aldersonia sp.]